MVQRLRHAPLGPANELFPSALLKKVHEFNRDHWHNSAILRVAGFPSNPRGSTPAPRSQSSHAARNSKKTADGSSKGQRFYSSATASPLLIHPFHPRVLLHPRRLFLRLPRRLRIFLLASKMNLSDLKSCVWRRIPSQWVAASGSFGGNGALLVRLNEFVAGLEKVILSPFYQRDSRRPLFGYSNPALGFLSPTTRQILTRGRFC